MREHNGIIKIESPLVKSMDESENRQVATPLSHSRYALFYALEVAADNKS